jgi:HlyD family secretion protein
MQQFFTKNGRMLIFLLLVAVALGAWIYTQRGANQGETLFQTTTIERGNLTASIGATGTVRSKQTAVLVWQTNGAVDTVNVKVGDNVPEGFVMAFLDKSSLSPSIIMAEADLVNAQATLDNLLNSDTALAQAVIALRDAKNAYEKALDYRESLDGLIDITEIVKKKKKTPFGEIEVTEIKKYKGYADATTIAKADEQLALTAARLEDAQRTYDRLSAGNQAEIKAAQARVDAALATLNLSRIIAPFSGIVTESYPLSGDQVNTGTKAFRIDDLSSLFVDVEVSEVDINSVAVGQAAVLTFDAVLGREYQGVVMSVAPTGTVTQGVVNFKVTVELTNADSLVKPGMTAAVEITVRELQDVILIPNRAVRSIEGVRYVYVLENGQAVQKRIRIISSSDRMSAIEEGEALPGDEIILNPPTEFGPGGGPGGGPFGN